MGNGVSLAAMSVSEQAPPSWPQISFIQDLATTSFPCAFRSRSLYRAASPAQASTTIQAQYSAPMPVSIGHGLVSETYVPSQYC